MILTSEFFFNLFCVKYSRFGSNWNNAILLFS